MVSTVLPLQDVCTYRVMRGRQSRVVCMGQSIDMHPVHTWSRNRIILLQLFGFAETHPRETPVNDHYISALYVFSTGKTAANYVLATLKHHSTPPSIVDGCYDRHVGLA